MSAMKIVFLAGDRQIILYAPRMKQMWQVESHVLERLGEEQCLKLDTAEFRKFWIDDERDQVEIMNNDDYEYFLKRTSDRQTPKIYFEARYPPTSTENAQQEQSQSNTASSSTQDRENANIHPTVQCDICQTAPLRGFRYKCLQCPNFDLCMKCEGEMKHSEHLMLRIPCADSPIWESFSPISFGRRRQRKCAAAAAAAAAAASAASNASAGEGMQQGEGKSRHHRHHRRHCSGIGNGGAGIWSHFYDMMQDLAEGGAVPQDSPTECPQKQQQPEASAPPQAEPTTSGAGVPPPTSADANSQTKETNTSPNFGAGAQTSPRGSTSAPPSFENLQNFIDPHFMKAGIQILNNFSEMFGKILDPVVAGDTTRSASTPQPVVIDIDLTGETRDSATPPPTAAGTPKEAAANQQTSAAGSGIVTPMETEVLPPSPPAAAPESQPRSRNSQSEENDWTMIDSSAATSTSPTTSPQLDYAKLSQQLQTHLENEMKGQTNISTTTSVPATPIPTPTSSGVSIGGVNSTPMVAPIAPTIAPSQVDAPVQIAAPVPVTASAPAVTPIPVAAPIPTPFVAPPAPTPAERRAVAVFHPDPRINDAVHAMMAMGFSNEGAMLTQLLESVNGSIPLALDLMSAAQRN